MGAWRSKLQAPGPFHPAGGVDRPAVGVAHPPAFVQPALTSPGPRGRGDPPDAGLPLVSAALLPVSLLRSGPRLLWPPVSTGRPRPQSARRRAAAPAEPGRPARSPRSPAGLPGPVPRPRDASRFPCTPCLRHPPSGPAPADRGRPSLRARRLRCARRARPTVPRDSPPRSGALVRALRAPGPVRPLAGGRCAAPTSRLAPAPIT